MSRLFKKSINHCVDCPSRVQKTINGMHNILVCEKDDTALRFDTTKEPIPVWCPLGDDEPKEFLLKNKKCSKCPYYLNDDTGHYCTEDCEPSDMTGCTRLSVTEVLAGRPDWCPLSEDPGFEQWRIANQKLVDQNTELRRAIGDQNKLLKIIGDTNISLRDRLTRLPKPIEPKISTERKLDLD